MANEIRITQYLECLNGNFQMPRTGKSLTVDQAVAGGMSPGMVELGALVTEVNLTELTKPGWLIMQNTDDTEYIDWGFGPDLGSETGTGTGTGNDGLGGRMLAGEFALFRLHPAAQLLMRASAEGVRAIVLALED